jgi:hypothetical protein
MVSPEARVTFHDLCLALERKLTARGGAFSVTISLLDPDRADLMAAIAPVLSKAPSDLSHTIRQSLQALASFKSGLSKRVRSRIGVRVHQAVAIWKCHTTRPPAAQR